MNSPNTFARGKRARSFRRQATNVAPVTSRSSNQATLFDARRIFQRLFTDADSSLEFFRSGASIALVCRIPFDNSLEQGTGIHIRGDPMDYLAIPIVVLRMTWRLGRRGWNEGEVRQRLGFQVVGE